MKVTTNEINTSIEPDVREKARALKLFREKKNKLKSQISNDIKSLLLRDPVEAEENIKTSLNSVDAYDDYNDYDSDDYDYDYKLPDYSDYYSDEFEKLLAQEERKTAEKSNAAKEVSYESRPNGGFSVYYTMPESEEIKKAEESSELDRWIESINKQLKESRENEKKQKVLEENILSKLKAAPRTAPTIKAAPRQSPFQQNKRQVVLILKN